MSRALSTDQQVLSRRTFVYSTAALGGGLALGIRLHAQEGGPAQPAAAGSPTRPPSAFIQIAADDSITITTPAVEMGQGGHTAMPMIMMEELGGDWRKLRVADAAADKVYNNPMFGQQSTVGSFSVRGWYVELRRMSAAAREMLVTAGAQKLGVPAGECTAANSIITHTPSGKKIGYGAVAAAAAQLPVPQQPVLKKAEEFTLIGTSPGRIDIPSKVDGSAQYGIDKRLPNMLYGAVKTAPQLTGKLKSFDDSAARGMPGFHSTVALDNGVVVLAASWWQAKKALDQVKVQFDPGKLGGVDSAKVSSLLQAAFSEPGTQARNDGNTERMLASAKNVLEAVYEVPYLAHACMEPMNCTAQVTADGCEVWCGTQSPQGAQSAAAAVLNIPAARVNVHTMYLGGGFGRRGESDYVAQAVAAAKAANRPVKLIWSREEDIQHDYYRPAAAIKFRAGFSADNSFTALECRVVTAAAPNFGGPNAPPFYTEAMSDMLYRIPNYRVTGVNKDIGVRFGFWRSVNLSHNPFMFEGMLDEIAARAKEDPYQFRRGRLQHEQARRQLTVLDVAAQKAGWGKAPAGHFQGIASLQGFGSFIASVVEVSAKGNTIVVHRVVNAIDCGLTVHPANVVAQLEGGMMYGLTAAARGEITLENGAVKQSNFHDYPSLLMAQAPLCESYLVESKEAPGGVGEPGTGPIAAALANAIFAATGTRICSLPLSRHNLELSVARA
jgi:isoquinoline 1-oxidoreductase beta subunit